MAVTKDEILDAISKMSVMEVVELISDMEKKFNVTAAAAVAATTSGGGGVPSKVLAIIGVRAGGPGESTRASLFISAS